MQDNYIKRIISPHYANFSTSEVKLADYFVNLGMDLVNKTLSNLSEETSLSEATIFKFVKKLGFKGFQDFKITIASNYRMSEQRSRQLTAITDIQSSDTPADISRKVIRTSQLMLQSLNDHLPAGAIEEAVDIIKNSKTLHFFGIGASSATALDAYQKFLRTTMPVNYVADFHMQLMHLSKLNEEDCVFIFSHSGKTHETIKLAEVARQTKAKIITLTGNPASPLGRLSDVNIVIETEESMFQSEVLSARMLYLIIVDIIYLSYLYHDEQVNQRSINAIRQILAKANNGEDEHGN